MTLSEEDLERVRNALSRASGPSRGRHELPLPIALDELGDWLVDPHQANARPVHWASLLHDLISSVDECGPRLTAALLGANTGAVDELRACYRLLKAGRNPPDASLRRRIRHVSDRLSSAESEGPALVAAFTDLCEASDADEADQRATLLMALAEAAGHDRRWLPSRLRNILADEGHAIALERGTDLPDHLPVRAGTAPAERVPIVESILQRPPERSEVVVWLRFLNADLRWPPMLAIGERVRLFEDRWLRSALASDDLEQIADAAPELLDEHQSSDVRLFTRADSEEAEVDGESRHPSVYARIAVPNATTSQAESIARRTADAIGGVASLYGTPPSLWNLEESFVSLSEGGSRFSFSAPPAHRLTAEDQAALSEDHTARNLADVAEKLGNYLPVRDSAITQAAILLSWLRTARLTQAPPRLLLCDRVIEQVSGWAGFAEPRRFISEYLKPSWVYGHIRNEVANAAFTSGYELRRQRPPNNSIADAFADADAGFGGTVNLKRFLELIDSVESSLAPGSDARERLQRLTRRVRSPAAWARELSERFDRLEGRRRRTRNVLVHGGPMSEGTIQSISDFAERLAVRAIATTIDGRLNQRDLIDHFLELRSDLEQFEQSLGKGKPLSEALFWDRTV